MPSISFIVPTVGRSTLGAALDSITTQMDSGDELLIKYDLTASWGNATRNELLQRAKGDFLMFMDDDDIFTAGAIKKVREHIGKEPARLHLFRMRYVTGRELWLAPVVLVGNVSTQMIAVPNVPEALGRFGDRYEGDYDFIVSSMRSFGTPIFIPEVISIYRPHERLNR